MLEAGIVKNMIVLINANKYVKKTYNLSIYINPANIL